MARMEEFSSLISLFIKDSVEIDQALKHWKHGIKRKRNGRYRIRTYDPQLVELVL